MINPLIDCLRDVRREPVLMLLELRHAVMCRPLKRGVIGSQFRGRLSTPRGLFGSRFECCCCWSFRTLSAASAAVVVVVVSFGLSDESGSVDVSTIFALSSFHCEAYDNALFIQESRIGFIANDHGVAHECFWDVVEHCGDVMP